MTEYTENFSLGMQTDHSDIFDMSIITDNCLIIDNCLKNLNERISEIEHNTGIIKNISMILTDVISVPAEKAGFTTFDEYFEED